PILGFRALQMMMGAGWLPKPPTSLTLPLTLLDQLWMLGWTLFIGRRYGRLPRLPGAESAIVEAVIAVPTWATMFVTFVMMAVFTRIVAGRSEPPANPLEKLSGLISHLELIGLALTAVVVAPVCEETFFRGMLHNTLRQRLPLLLAIPI